MADGAFYTLTKPAPVVFLDLFRARKFKDSKGREGPPRFGATFLLTPDHPDLAPINSLIVQVKDAEKTLAGRSMKDLGSPLQAGDPSVPFKAGKVLLRTQSAEDYAPPLFVFENGAVKLYDGQERVLAQPAFYAGVEAVGEIKLVAYDGFGGGVTAYLNSILSYNVGPKIIDRAAMDGAKKYAESMKHYVGRVSDVDPTAGMKVGNEELAY